MESLFYAKRLVFIVFGLLALLACSDNCREPLDEKVESVYDRMGRLHNEGLDYVLGEILKHSPLTKSGGREIPSTDEIREMCTEFAATKGETGSADCTSNVGRDSLDLSTLSIGQREWLDEIYEVIWSASVGQVDELIINLEKVECRLQVDMVLPRHEKEPLLYAIAVCRYSAKYWIENYEKWQVELYGVDKPHLPKIHTRGEYVSESWWNEYKLIVWVDGVGGISLGDGGYYLDNANVSSVQECLRKR